VPAVKQDTLYQVCPRCNEGPVVFHSDEKVYRCADCGLTLVERSVLGIFKKQHYGISSLGQGDFDLANQGLKSIALKLDLLKVVINNVYTDQQLAQIVAGDLDVIRPVKTTLAEIILAQLIEATYFQVNGLRRAHGPTLPEGGDYQPVRAAPRSEMNWQDEGNLFGTTHRLVLPSDSFTFIRMDRKVVGVQAFMNGVALQRRGEDFATYFMDCFPHEAALVAAFAMAKIPALRSSKPEKIANGE
jgi:ribosomal protein S27AE